MIDRNAKIKLKYLVSLHPLNFSCSFWPVCPAKNVLTLFSSGFAKHKSCEVETLTLSGCESLALLNETSSRERVPIKPLETLDLPYSWVIGVDIVYCKKQCEQHFGIQLWLRTYAYVMNCNLGRNTKTHAREEISEIMNPRLVRDRNGDEAFS